MAGGDFNEDDHPRDEGGQFAAGTGGEKQLTPKEHADKAKFWKTIANGYRETARLGIGKDHDKKADTAEAKAKFHEDKAKEGKASSKSASPAPKAGAEKLTKEQTATFAKYGQAKTQGGKSVKDVLSHMRTEHVADGAPEGFAEASTDTIAKGMNITKGQALKLLQRAAKEGHVTRRGHEFSNLGKVKTTDRGFGHQIWQYANSKKLPED